MELEKFVDRYARLYHMAERGSWPSIRDRGLLSTKARLDLAGLRGHARRVIESELRRDKVPVEVPGDAPVVLRDQKPMSQRKLEKHLLNGVTPAQWCRFLNSKVFFWATPDRLDTLLAAGPYAQLEHDILTIDTASLVARHSKNILLCRLNSGSTKPYGTDRDFSIFLPITSYPVNTKGNPRREVAEVLLDYAVADIADHVLDVKRMRGDDVTRRYPYGRIVRAA